MAGARGEAMLQAGEREVHILFTNRALADVEQRVGRSIMALLQGAIDGSTTMGETVQMLRAGMEAARRDAHEPGPAVAINTAFDVMDAAGFGPTMAAVMEAVGDVLAYDPGGDGAEEAGDPNL